MLFDGFGSHNSRFRPPIRIGAVQKYFKHPVCFVFVQPSNNVGSHERCIFVVPDSPPTTPICGWVNPQLCETVGYCRSTKQLFPKRTWKKSLSCFKVMVDRGRGYPVWLPGGRLEKKNRNQSQTQSVGKWTGYKNGLHNKPWKIVFEGSIVWWAWRDWPAVGADVLSAPGAGAHVPLLETVARATFTQRVGPVAGHLHSLTHSPLLLYWLSLSLIAGVTTSGVAGERGRLQNNVYILYIHGRAQFINVIAPFLLRIISLPDVYITTWGHPCTPRPPFLTIVIYLVSPSSIHTKS